MYNMRVALNDFGNFDLVVVGGGCTGVFAAVRAARLGLKVAIVEKSNCFGGVATNGLVNVWHTLLDADGKEQIIAGLTEEVQNSLIKGGYACVQNTQSAGIRFDPNAMKLMLDELVEKNRIHVFFHTHYGSLIQNGNRIEKIIVANKDGLGTVTASFFIDASGDGDLCRDAGIPCYTASAIQPPTPCCLINGEIKGNFGELVLKHGKEFGLDDDWGWSGFVPGLKNVSMRADFHITDKLCCRAEDLTRAEIEGRRKMYALGALLKKYSNPEIGIVDVCSGLGIRETVHFETAHKADQYDLLLGKTFEDPIMKGSYRIDIHDSVGGLTFKYLNGKKVYHKGKMNSKVESNWREEEGFTGDYARHYELPFEILVQNKIENLIPVGRMIHADEGAFGALRVMVNLNQLGEAAGVAAYLSVNGDQPIQAITGKQVRKLLVAGGSL